jgi:hypothetical protein
MTIPRPKQTVHLMNWRDVMRVYWNVRREQVRNARELELYTTDDLRRLYQATGEDPIRLRDGIVSRVELVATIRWRVLWERISYFVLLLLTVVAAIASVIAAAEGWK